MPKVVSEQDAAAIEEGRQRVGEVPGRGLTQQKHCARCSLTIAVHPRGRGK